MTLRFFPWLLPRSFSGHLSAFMSVFVVVGVGFIIISPRFFPWRLPRSFSGRLSAFRSVFVSPVGVGCLILSPRFFPWRLPRSLTGHLSAFSMAFDSLFLPMATSLGYLLLVGNCLASRHRMHHFISSFLPMETSSVIYRAFICF